MTEESSCGTGGGPVGALGGGLYLAGPLAMRLEGGKVVGSGFLRPWDLSVP